MKAFNYRIDRSNMFHCFNYRPFGCNMFAFLNVNRDQQGRHVHVDTRIIDCGNGGVRCFELSRREYKTRNYRNARRFFEGWQFLRMAVSSKKFRVGGKNRRSVGFPETRHFFSRPYSVAMKNSLSTLKVKLIWLLTTGMNE